MPGKDVRKGVNGQEGRWQLGKCTPYCFVVSGVTSKTLNFITSLIYGRNKFLIYLLLLFATKIGCC